jgi:hypothetical protein
MDQYHKLSHFNMLKLKKQLFVILLTIFLTFSFQNFCNGQIVNEGNEICYDPNINTILLYKTGNEMSFPILRFRENETLSLDFDYLDENSSNYSYSVNNCMYDWKINTISDNLYIDGFNDIPINDFRSSMNTTRLYTHYSANIPNEDMEILSSGNYLLKVFKNAEPEKPVFTKRFCVSENLVEINSRIIMPDEETHELQLEIDLKNLDLMNPLAEIKIVVIKNYDWNNQIKIKSAPLLREKKLCLDMPFQISAPGGNEFRNFDIKNTRYESERIAYIEFQNPYYHFHLKADKLKQFTPYFTSQDFNSHFYIDVPKAYKRHEEADYVYVHFTLESAQPFASDVYIYGALTGYKTDTSNYMTYNLQKGIYEKTLLLKQGFYDYAYLTKDYNKNNIEFDLTEGNHSETENDYVILVYLRKPVSDIDRLIGYRIINSSMK